MNGKIKSRVAADCSRGGWLILALVLVLILVSADGSALAQGPEGEGVTTAATVGLKISYQGKLTDASGSPVSGDTSVKFTLYDSTSTALWTETKTISPDSDGVFTTQLGDTTALSTSLFDGRALWLGVKVGSDAEMTPRQELLPAPYAAGLRPGALISDTSSSMLLDVSNYGSGHGVYAYSFGNVGVFGQGNSYYGVLGQSNSSYGVSGYSSSSHGVHGRSGTASGILPSRAGVWGDSQGGLGVVGTSSNNYGVHGRAGNPSGQTGFFRAGVWGDSQNHMGVVGSSSNDTALYGVSTSGIGAYGYSANNYGVQGSSTNSVGGIFYSQDANIIEAWDSWDGSDSNLRFRVSNAGDVYADGGYRCGYHDPNDTADDLTYDPCLKDDTGAADFAEMMAASGDPVPGDVLVINAEGRLIPATTPYAANVVGVYSTKPSYLGGGAKFGQEGYVPLAIVGIVPVKASAENGSIVPGDLLTTSSTPGHVMKAKPVDVGGVEIYRSGTIVGKALGSLAEGTGVIEMLVMLQ